VVVLAGARGGPRLPNALRSLSPLPRFPPLPLGPPLDRRWLPQRADAVDLVGLGELSFLMHLRPPLVGDAEVTGNVGDARGAALTTHDLLGG
jgi:hypothetical protein